MGFWEILVFIAWIQSYSPAPSGFPNSTRKQQKIGSWKPLMNLSHRKAQRAQKNSCFGNKSTLKSWGTAEFVRAAAASPWLSVSPVPSPGRQPCCHCLFLQGKPTAHLLLWERPRERGWSHAGVVAAAARSQRGGGAVLCPRRDVTTGRARTAARAPHAYTCNKAPAAQCPSFCTVALPRTGRERNAPIWPQPLLQGFVRPPDTWALVPHLDGRGKLWLCLKDRLRWLGEKSLGEMLKNHRLGAVCLKRTPFVWLLSPNKEVTGK